MKASLFEIQKFLIQFIALVSLGDIVGIRLSAYLQLIILTLLMILLKPTSASYTTTPNSSWATGQVWLSVILFYLCTRVQVSWHLWTLAWGNLTWALIDVVRSRCLRSYWSDVLRSNFCSCICVAVILFLSLSCLFDFRKNKRDRGWMEDDRWIEGLENWNFSVNGLHTSRRCIQYKQHSEKHFRKMIWPSLLRPKIPRSRIHACPIL